MLTWILRRVLAVVPVLFGVTVAVFSMLFLVPGDPVKMMLAEFVTNPDQVAAMRAQLHLDEPIVRQYGRFVANAVRGDLGTSIRSRRPVTTEIAENVASTAQLASAAMLVALAVGVPLGLLAALARGSWLDVASMATALLGVSMPSFWLGLLLIFVFSLQLGWFPATGGGDLAHLVLPSLTLGAIAAAIIARLTRSSMLEVLGQD
jgi:peptide/nickel transport system permease protein/oligopeptide transport system permease protein